MTTFSDVINEITKKLATAQLKPLAANLVDTLEKMSIENIDMLAKAHGCLAAARLHKQEWSKYVKDPNLSKICAALIKLPEGSRNKLGMAAVIATQKSQGRVDSARERIASEIANIIAGEPTMNAKDTTINITKLLALTALRQLGG